MVSNIVSRSVLLLCIFISSPATLLAQSETFACDEKPWIWWYWMGSAVSERGIDGHLEKFAKMGYGGANITATYGTLGNEADDIPFMSREWIEKINYTAIAASKRQMAIDLSLSSAWPFGGPNVTADMAARHSRVGKLFSVRGARKVAENIRASETEKIEAIAAFSDTGERLLLTQNVTALGLLEFSFPHGNWDVYGLFSAPTGQQTKRSGIGGEGPVLDHFDKASVQKYLDHFNPLFVENGRFRATFNDSYEVYGADYTPRFLEEFGNRRGYRLEEHLNLFCSAEKNDARCRLRCDYRETISDLLHECFLDEWTAWAHSHGVQTVEQAHGSPANLLDLYAAADIPQTESFGASELGIPGVRIDPDYSPKTFGRPDKLILKFASSAAHVEGKKLTSSESATWLGNHFKVALSQVKPQIDELFLCGVNHIMLTCAAYSPENAPFPGWRFYPAANFGPTSAFADYLPAFSLYVARSQKLLQNSRADNEVLLYLPIHDLWTECEDEDDRGQLKMFTVHAPQTWLYKIDLGATARRLRLGGFDFDYISDRQILRSTASGGQIVAPGGATYKTLVIPGCIRMPVATLAKLRDWAKDGVPLVFADRMPTDVPGFHRAAERREELSRIAAEMQSLEPVHLAADFSGSLQSPGTGPFFGEKSHLDGKQSPENMDLSPSHHNSAILQADLIGALQRQGLRQEHFEESHLTGFRAKNEKGILYFIANQSRFFREGWVELGSEFRTADIYDPLTGVQGTARTDGRRIYLQLEPGKSCFLKLYDDAPHGRWNYFRDGPSFTINGDWNISFLKGGPTLPPAYQAKTLDGWENAPDREARFFSGVGRYEILFDLPSQLTNRTQYKLSLGDVREAADVWINDAYVGRTWSVPFDLDVDPKLVQTTGNKLRIEVRNLDANRIIWMDQNKIPWQKFFFVDIAYRRFDAAAWEPMPSGLLGPVKLTSSRED